ncbi:MAG: Asp-tRNA(Asn)/Glu-tRNA(Gln) amidotransferase subunit GatC [Campylobacterota bacterium]|nr:Asp-tRNA(Asn)/Glu-tRNA(Gln) amidotransferase subunit GatC [Campylobacterota bacterium]
MIIDDKIIDKIAKLSSLEVAEDKKEALKAEIEDIVNFVDVLNDVDVSHVDATFTTIAGGTPYREDIASKNQEFSEAIIKNAPKSEDGYFIVPKIIE